jgi:hypothetical protein
VKNQLWRCGPECVAFTTQRFNYYDVMVTKQETVKFVISFGMLENMEGRAEKMLI